MQNQSESHSARSALRDDCLGLLQSLQNADGGWPFQAAQQSRVEPTAWAMRALFDRGNENPPASSESARRAAEFLRSSQLADGSWPASPQISTGSWITSLACAALAGDPQSAAVVSAGLQWLCDDFPRDSSAFRRFLNSMRRGPRLSEQSDSLRGWGWTPRTSSWVEPTSFALMALRSADPKLLPASARQRCDQAVALLYDRMCPGGGWNCGNPRVYGVDGEALVLATCWALLAIRDFAEKPGRAVSLAWVQNNFPQVRSAASLAVATMTLENYGIQLPAGDSLVNAILQNGVFSSPETFATQGTHVLSWVALALDPNRAWPPVAKPTAAVSASTQGSRP